MTPDPDRLDALLEREPYLDDGGFTARVLEALPPPRRSRRRLILGVSGAAAALTAALVLPGAVKAGLAALGALALPAALPTGLVVGLAAAAVAGATAWLVALKARRRTPPMPRPAATAAPPAGARRPRRSWSR